MPSQKKSTFPSPLIRTRVLSDCITPMNRRCLSNPTRSVSSVNSSGITSKTSSLKTSNRSSGISISGVSGVNSTKTAGKKQNGPGQSPSYPTSPPGQNIHQRGRMGRKTHKHHPRTVGVPQRPQIGGYPQQLWLPSE